MAAVDYIGALVASNEKRLADELYGVVADGVGRIDAFMIGRALDDIDGNHIRDQIGMMLSLDDDGVPEGWSTKAATISPALTSFVGAVAAHAAAQARHVLNPQHAALAPVTAGANRVAEQFLTDTLAALADAIETAIYGPGSPESRGAQIRRSFGLTIKQATTLEHMRVVLQRYVNAPRRLIPARVDANGVRIPPQFARKIDTRGLLRSTRGHISAAQAKLLAKALSQPNLTAAQADALLDKHADAMRAFRVRVVAGEVIHGLAEKAKLTGWQIAQKAGALPADQRRFWQTAGDERVRHTHSQVPAMNAGGVSLDAPFQTPFGRRHTPPLEHGCRCKAVLRHV